MNMETIDETATELLFSEPKFLDELHRECLTWQSEIDFWDIELNFFQKLLSTNFSNNRSNDDDFTNEAIQGKLIRFKQEAIDEFKEDLLAHEEYLNDLVINKLEVHDDMYRDNHFIYEKHIFKLERKFKDLKIELFDYVQSLI